MSQGRCRTLMVPLMSDRVISLEMHHQQYTCTRVSMCNLFSQDWHWNLEKIHILYGSHYLCHFSITLFLSFPLWHSALKDTQHRWISWIVRMEKLRRDQDAFVWRKQFFNKRKSKSHLDMTRQDVRWPGMGGKKKKGNQKTQWDKTWQDQELAKKMNSQKPRETRII